MWIEARCGASRRADISSVSSPVTRQFASSRLLSAFAFSVLSRTFIDFSMRPGSASAETPTEFRICDGALVLEYYSRVMLYSMETAPPRERLLDAATELFAAEGYDAVGVERLRARAGVSNGSFF